MRRSYRVLAQVVGVAVMLAGVSGCVLQTKEHPRGFPEAASQEISVPASPKTAAPSSALTDARARSALLREDDLGGAWAGTQGAATWRDGLLKGRTDLPECQELLDAVYAEDLLGEPRGGVAVIGFDDDEYGAQLRYQVGAYDKGAVDARLGQVGQLVGRCGEFTITGVQGREHYARVTPVDLPDGIGDAQQALRLVVADGEEGSLTLDLAAVRVGDTAVFLTHGGLYGIDDTATRDAARAGAQRLREVLKKDARERKPREKDGREREPGKKEPQEKGERRSSPAAPSPSGQNLP